MNDSMICMTLGAIAAAYCWCLIATVSMLAVFSKTVSDTVLERIALSWVSIGAVAAAYRVMAVGKVSEPFLFASLGFGFYAVVIFLKHYRMLRACCHR